MTPKDIVEKFKVNMEKMQKSELALQSHLKPQLRTYVHIRDFIDRPSSLYKPLSFIQRKFLMKFITSCLEISICTGRYSGTALEDRVCPLTTFCSEQKLVETEVHFLLVFPAFDQLRKDWLSRIVVPHGFNLFSDMEKVKQLVNNPDLVKPTAQFIIDAFDSRSKLIYSKK